MLLYLNPNKIIDILKGEVSHGSKEVPEMV